ncbi:translationally-controlled tumor protein-like [Tenrec ecaudatus]|uniref:translationally-controlled tumor protein-like n=1 Tax=Tenrec ecaudatus TaxID=94439 RepID=UPI003F59B50B
MTLSPHLLSISVSADPDPQFQGAPLRPAVLGSLRAPAPPKLAPPLSPSSRHRDHLPGPHQHDEMFSDIYKIWEIADRLCLEVEGKLVSGIEGNIGDSLIGGNTSAEGPDGDAAESTVVTGVDIIMNHQPQETRFTKEAYKKYIKDYMKSIKCKLEEQKPERVKPFMTGAAEQTKHILANFKNYQYFLGENMNPDGMVAPLDYRQNGGTPYMNFFQDGLEMETC